MAVLGLEREAEALGVAFVFLGQDVGFPDDNAGSEEGAGGCGCGVGVVDVGGEGGSRDGCGGLGTVGGV